MKKLFLGFIILALANATLQSVFANEQSCDPADFARAEQHLDRRERLAQKGLALYSNPKELEELNRNFKSAHRLELVSKSLFVTSLLTFIGRGGDGFPKNWSSIISKDAGNVITASAGMMGAGTFVFGGAGELIRYGEKKEIERIVININGGGFKVFDEAREELTKQRQQITNEFEGIYGRFKNSVTLGSAGTDAQWALRMEYVGHAEIYKKELEYIKFQRGILERAKKNGVCEHSEDIGRSAVNERQQLIDAIDEMMDLRKVVERDKMEADIL